MSPVRSVTFVSSRTSNTYELQIPRKAPLVAGVWGLLWGCSFTMLRKTELSEPSIGVSSRMGDRLFLGRRLRHLLATLLTGLGPRDRQPLKKLCDKDPPQVKSTSLKPERFQL
jgi:hypothetical protein